MVDLPEFVYLITVDTEWMVTALADDHPSIAERVDREVQRRCANANYPPARAHVWKARLADVCEVDLMPAATVRPSLRERDDG